MRKYDLVALGGTFDIVHKGHLKLISTAFENSNKIIIGLTSDEFAIKKGKKILHNYPTRLENLKGELSKNFPKRIYEISKLENDFGPAVLEGRVQALVVSEETSNQGEILNRLRSEKKLSKVDVIIVPMLLADDGTRISTSRIKISEIDKDGKPC